MQHIFEDKGEFTIAKLISMGFSGIVIVFTITGSF